MARPSGCDMSLTTAAIRRPAAVPMSTIARARASAESRSCMNAPEPVLTSRTMTSAPAASFLDMMLLAISGRLGTVLVTSRRAYSLPSAGARSADWPVMTIPTSRNWRTKAAASRSTRIPGNDSSLSIVPPVKPSPRPLILPTGTPHAATSGMTTSDVLSPTPPVECLSATGLPIDDRSSCAPPAAMTWVSVTTSSGCMPRQHTAISQAATW